MCRKQQVWSCCLMAFGTGVLIGRWMESWFWGGICGVLLIGIGCAMLGKRT